MTKHKSDSHSFPADFGFSGSCSDGPVQVRGHQRARPMAKGGGIHIKPSHKGLLHKDLGVPAGQPIPAAKLEKAENSSSPAVRKRAVFAENAKHWNHKAKGGPVVPEPTVIADDAGATPAMEMRPPPAPPAPGGLARLRGARGAPAFRSKPLIGGR